WEASRWDGGKHHRVPAEAAVKGRLIAVRVGRGKSKQWLYLFTTLDWSRKLSNSTDYVGPSRRICGR
ncbi:MAG: hypothetical protein M3Y27_15505, partial [Acidobacteriota bacterium]|nr:hypothetical protein [Acidobacteriota bacterium]